MVYSGWPVALAANPRLLFADEPTTALDVTIQAQILDLLRDIQQKLGTAAVLVSHDLGVAGLRVLDAHQLHQLQHPPPYLRPIHPGLMDPHRLRDLRSDGHGGVPFFPVFEELLHV